MADNDVISRLRENENMKGSSLKGLNITEIQEKL